MPSGMNKPSFNKPAMGKPVIKPAKPMTKPSFNKPADDGVLLRRLPITEKQLGQIKKHYGIK